MIKYLISFLLFVFIPGVLFARDACTDPDAFTVDRRCYVTDEQKTEKPYNAVVKVYGCTGTIVKIKNDYYIYTAKHCIGSKTVDSYESIPAVLQNGTTVMADRHNVGKFNKATDENQKDDWAIYKIRGEYNDGTLPYVYISDKWDWGMLSINRDARSVGYGALKIMSDAEIKEFKARYITYLATEKGIPYEQQTEDTTYGFVADEGIKTNNPYATNFIYDFLLDTDWNYIVDIFGDDHALKVSECKYATDGSEINCQSWGGNSGGGIFDNNGDIMGIHVWGNPIIGGENHADSAGGINLQISAWGGIKRNVKSNLQNIVDVIKGNDTTVNGKEVESM